LKEVRGGRKERRRRGIEGDLLKEGRRQKEEGDVEVGSLKKEGRKEASKGN
jgi:hypothetical protein